MKRLLHVLLLALFAIQLNAQKETFIFNDTAKNGTVKLRRFNITGNTKLHLASEEKELLKTTLGLSANDSLLLISSKNDKIGYNIKLYQQYYKGYKVEYATYTTHIKNGIIETISGQFAKVGSPIVSSPYFSASFN
jgi:Zn-dependent metalloprotease